MAPTKKPNPFMKFVTHWRDNNPGGWQLTLPQAVAHCDGIWQKMNPQQREPFTAEAKEAKMNKQQVVPIPPAPRDQAEQQMQRAVERYVKKLEDLENTKFVFCSFNYFTNELKTGGFCVPAEIALCQYSFREGLISMFGSLINPGYLGIGQWRAAHDHSQSTHNLPLPPKAMGECYMDRMCGKILNYLGKCQSQRPYMVFTATDMIPIVKSCFAFMANEIPKHPQSIDMQKILVYDIQYLFYTLKAETYGGSRYSIHLTNAFFLKDMYEYAKNIACDYHEADDRSLYCVQSIITRWSYQFSDYMCRDLGIGFTLGKHCPINLKKSNYESSLETLQAMRIKDANKSRRSEDLPSTSSPPKGVSAAAQAICDYLAKACQEGRRRQERAAAGVRFDLPGEEPSEPDQEAKKFRISGECSGASGSRMEPAVKNLFGEQEDHRKQDGRPPRTHKDPYDVEEKKKDWRPVPGLVPVPDGRPPRTYKDPYEFKNKKKDWRPVPGLVLDGRRPRTYNDPYYVEEKKKDGRPVLGPVLDGRRPRTYNDPLDFEDKDPLDLEEKKQDGRPVPDGRRPRTYKDPLYFEEQKPDGRRNPVRFGVADTAWDLPVNPDADKKVHKPRRPREMLVDRQMNFSSYVDEMEEKNRRRLEQFTSPEAAWNLSANPRRGPRNISPINHHRSGASSAFVAPYNNDFKENEGNRNEGGGSGRFTPPDAAWDLSMNSRRGPREVSPINNQRSAATNTFVAQANNNNNFEEDNGNRNEGGGGGGWGLFTPPHAVWDLPVNQSHRDLWDNSPKSSQPTSRTSNPFVAQDHCDLEEEEMVRNQGDPLRQEEEPTSLILPDVVWDLPVDSSRTPENLTEFDFNFGM